MLRAIKRTMSCQAMPAPCKMDQVTPLEKILPVARLAKTSQAVRAHGHQTLEIQKTVHIGQHDDAGRSSELRTYARSIEDLFEQFLNERCSRSKNTELNYRGVLRRLQRFCENAGLPSVLSLSRTHWPAWQDYLRNPPPKDIMKASVAWGSPGWAPFRGPLAARSATQSELVAKAFFAWASDVSIGAMPYNPVASIKTPTVRRSATKEGVHRALEDTEMVYVMRAIDLMPSDTATQRAAKARARWVITLAVNSGLRAHEIASARVKDIVPNPRAGAASFSLRVVRKGSVESEIPLHPSILSAWSEYKRSVGPIQPDSPLVMPLRIATKSASDAAAESGSCTTRATIWNIVKEVMYGAADLAESDADIATAHRLKKVSTHWLRHTFGSNLLSDGADLLAVRDLMDHASVTTTNQYLHNPQARLAAAVNQLRDRATSSAQPPLQET